MLAATGTVYAQDAGVRGSPIVEKFTAALNIAPADPAKKPKVDAALVSAFVVKVGLCYRAEVGKPLSETDRTLLHEFGPELVVQFASALNDTGCDAHQPPSEACVQHIDQLDCDTLAEVVRNNGWDRAPSPEMEAAIDRYTTELSMRYLACQAGNEIDVEVHKIRAEYLSHSASVQIAMLLTTGQCTLNMEQLEPCLTRMASHNICPGVLEHAKHSRLPRFCSEFLDCSAEPALVGKIAQ
jgi:hypothetical protein